MIMHINAWITRLRKFSPTTCLRLASISKNNHGITEKIFYAVKGKNTVASDSPENLVDQLLVLNGFSRQDSFDIIGLLNSNRKVASKKIKNAFFEKNIILLEIIDTNTNQTDLLHAADILTIPNVEKYYSHNDILMLYCHCVQQQAAEQRYSFNSEPSPLEKNIVTFANDKETYGI